MSATEAPASGGGSPSSSTDNVIEVRDLHVTFAGHVGLIAGLSGKKVLALAGESG